MAECSTSAIKQLANRPSFNQAAVHRERFTPAQQQQRQSLNVQLQPEEQQRFDQSWNESASSSSTAMPPNHHQQIQPLPWGIPQMPEWSQDFDRFQQSQRAPLQDPAMAAHFEKIFQAGMSSSGITEFQDTAELARRIDPMIMGSMANISEDQWAQQFDLLSSDLKGKAKLESKEAADWDSQFESAMEQHKQALAEQHGDMSEFENVWRDVLPDEMQRQMQENFHNWEEEFADTHGGGAGSAETPAVVQRFDKPYVFEENNPYLAHVDPLAEAYRLLEQGASLTDTALAFEAAVQRNGNNAEAWARLGLVQAENEKEDAAIAALRAAISADPNHLEAIMSLAVSYTNEGFDEEAFKLLDSWIGTKYPDIHSIRARDRSVDDMAVYEVFERVQSSFLEAARKTSTTSTIDADLQIGLGILFYNSGQYDKAVDCFNTALQVNPRNYLLWNRLGATLANSGRSEEAIDAYFHALEIKPTFVRGRYNLGVSCMNIGCYREAAEHFLGALVMHEATPETRNVSVNLWDTLKRTFVLMERRDLAEIAAPGANVEVFRKDFAF